MQDGTLQILYCFRVYRRHGNPLVSLGVSCRSAPIRSISVRHFGDFRARPSECSRPREPGENQYVR